MSDRPQLLCRECRNESGQLCDKSIQAQAIHEEVDQMHEGRGARALLVAAIGSLSLLGLAVPASAATDTAATTSTSNVATGLGPVEHVPANGLSIGYRTGGHGTWLIMVMGRSGTMADWDPLLIQQLTRDHRVLIFDNRGMGTTNDDSVATSDVSIPLMAQDTLALAGALGIHTFDLMGWSMGGEIAQQVTVDAPSRVLKLVLCATGAGGPTEKLPSAPVQKLMSEPDLPTTKLFALSFPPTPAGTKGAADYAAAVAAQYKLDHLPSDSFSTSSAGLAGQQNARTEWTSSSGGVYNDLAKLGTQTLVMWGNLDVVDPPANDQTIVKQLHNATSKVFSGAGHAFLFQDAQQVGQTTDAFLGSGGANL
jgi:pimeloyl-ACP methyl ester carboxylesterase